MAGTTVAAIVSGNTVLLKPAIYHPCDCSEICGSARRSRFPKGVIKLCSRKWSEIGDYLVDHPKTRFISFTGSREVGFEFMNVQQKFK